MGVSRPHKKRLDYWVSQSPAKEKHCAEYWRLYDKYVKEDTKHFICIKCLDVWYDTPAPYKYGTRRKMCYGCSDKVYNKNTPRNQDVVLVEKYEI
tara:strand:- start:193 stop:477 length:285 start_codon:yes stop_codon:yes gene_type:complete